MTAATFIAPTSAYASSLESGDHIQITAWGGSELGYAYTYFLDGTQPTGVAIDVDMGRLSLASPLAVGTYSFGVIVNNREDSGSATFTFTLNVLAGINGTIGTTTPTTSQIAHFTYDPHSGTWGTPTGNDWTAVFNAMQTAILADQTRCNAVWDESSRMFVNLHLGTTYQYTNNAWLQGIQYVKLLGSVGTGAQPILQCTRSDPGGSNPYSDGPFNLSVYGSIQHQGSIKASCATIATVAAGSTTVTLLVSGDASKIKVGRWHVVIGWTIQVGGYPPNEQFIDYVKVTAVAGTTVTLDRPLKYGYSQAWYENTSDDQSLGVARLCPYDTGGTGGYIPADPRVTIRGRMYNLNFLGNPNFPGGPNINGANIFQIDGGIDWAFDLCNIPNAQISLAKHFYIKNCTQTWQWEPDKQSETITFDNYNSVGQMLGGATGFQYMLIRNSTIGGMQVSPRQLRTINSSFSGAGDGSYPGTGGAAYGPPVTVAYNGPLWYWDFGMAGGCQFTHGLDNHWMYGQAAADVSLVLGTDASFSGAQLQIPSTFSNFQSWLTWSTPGSIVSTNPSPTITTNWGYVASAASSATQHWLNITWVNGTQPTTGTLYLFRRRRLAFAAANTFTTGTLFASPGFTKEVAPGDETGWDYPSGYPAPYNDSVATSYADGSGNIMISSQAPATGFASGSTPTYADGSCTMMQGSALLGTGSTGTTSGNMVFTFSGGTVTVIIQGTPPSLLADYIPGATAAYSLRRVRRGYGGAAVNVRRSSDNATQDIGFVGDDFDTASFSSFIGAGTGFVAIWYDQIGSANATAIGGLTANQSPIALAVTGTGKPVVNSTATTQGMIAATSPNGANVSLVYCANRTGGFTSYALPLSYDGNAPGLTYNNTANGGYCVGIVNVNITSPAAATDNAFHSAVGIMTASGAMRVIADNGTPVTGTQATTTGATQIDLVGRASFGFLGYLAEAFIWPRALTTTEITAIRNDHRNYYGTP